MSEWIKVIAEVEWIALGIIFFVGLRLWNRKFSVLYDELKESIESMEEG